MPTFIHGSGAVFKLDNGAGTLNDISQYIVSIDAGYSRAMHDTTTLGKTARVFQPGLREGTISLTLRWEATIAGQMYDLYNSSNSSTFQDSPAGTTSGKRRAGGECYLVDIGESQMVDDIEQVTVTLQCSDTITFDTH